MKDSHAYSPEELLNASGLPEKGELCHHCGVRVPQFEQMDEALHYRIVHLIDRQQQALATKELIAAVKCPLTFAKIWVTHRGRAKPVFPGPACPHCGKPLRTSRARQCPHCFRAWHHEELPERERAIYTDVIAAVAAVKGYACDLGDFQLALADSLQDPMGANLAIILDAVLEKGWSTDGYQQMDGYRIYRYKAD